MGGNKKSKGVKHRVKEEDQTLGSEHTMHLELYTLVILLTNVFPSKFNKIKEMVSMWADGGVN